MNNWTIEISNHNIVLLKKIKITETRHLYEEIKDNKEIIELCRMQCIKINE